MSFELRISAFLDRLKDALFWRQRFDYYWRDATEGFEYNSDAQDLLRNTKYKWREECGRPYGSALACAKAYVEFANAYLRESKNTPEYEKTKMALASRIFHVVPYTDRFGRLLDRKEIVGETWAEFV